MATVAHALTTLANVKSYLGISSSSFDTLLEVLIDNVTEFVEGKLGGRRIKTETYTDELYDGGNTEIFLRQFPVTDLTKIQHRSGEISNPTFNDFNANDFILYEGGGFIHFFGGTPKGHLNLRFTYVAGFGEIPDDIEMIAKQLVAKAFDQRKSQGKSSERLENSSIDWTTMLSPEQKSVLARYRKHSFSTK